MKRGFTLVELVVVLLILAVLTHLAVHEVGRIRDRKLAQAADRQLEEIRTAAASYLSDVGSPVPVTNGTLSALWMRPASVRPYAARPAALTNLVAGAKGLKDEKVYVPTGWRGPYLKLPMGRTRLLDPWGNRVEETDDAGLKRIEVQSGVATAVSHYGARGQARDRRTLELGTPEERASRLVVTAISMGGSVAGDISLAWYGPCEGLVTGAVETVSIGSPVVFEGLTPGVRILKDSITKQARQVVVQPGDNVVEIKLP